MAKKGSPFIILVSDCGDKDQLEYLCGSPSFASVDAAKKFITKENENGDLCVDNDTKIIIAEIKDVASINGVAWLGKNTL